MEPDDITDHVCECGMTVKGEDWIWFGGNLTHSVRNKVDYYFVANKHIVWDNSYPSSSNWHFYCDAMSSMNSLPNRESLYLRLLRWLKA